MVVLVFWDRKDKNKAVSGLNDTALKQYCELIKST